MYDFHIDIILRLKSKWIWYAQQDLYQWYEQLNRIYLISNIQVPSTKHWIINFMTFQLNVVVFFIENNQFWISMPISLELNSGLRALLIWFKDQKPKKFLNFPIDKTLKLT